MSYHILPYLQMHFISYVKRVAREDLTPAYPRHKLKILVIVSV